MAGPRCGHRAGRQLTGVPREYAGLCDSCLIQYATANGILFAREQGEDDATAEARGRQLPGTAKPSATGTQRRIQALMARAWSPGAIERAAGIPAASIRRALADKQRITPALAAAVSRAYDRLWDQQPPRGTSRQRSAAEAHLEHAQRCGWAPPMAWDDDEIDREDARPAEGWRRNGRHTIRSADLIEAAEFVRETGGYRQAPDEAVASRLGVTREVLAQAYSRQRTALAELEAG